MRRPLPSLNALRMFDAAARRGSFTQAGRELGVTQGAVSHQIRQLETHLGFPLFHRAGRGVVLTEEGAELAKAVAESLDRISSTLWRIEQQRTSGTVHVSASPSFAVCWLVPHLDAFQLAHPEIDVRISATDRVVDPAREGFDVCIRYGEGGYHDLEVRQLTTDRVFPVCSPRLLDGPDALRRPQDLARFRLLSDTVFADRKPETDWERWARVAGVDLSASARTRFSHASMAITAAVAGQGVTLARSSLVSIELAEQRLVCPFGPTLLSPFSYWIVAPEGRMEIPRVHAFTTWMADTMAAGGP
ncbi:MAG: LysR family glycine cleavage system transcriptional activator [Myxococcota bacterium]